MKSSVKANATLIVRHEFNLAAQASATGYNHSHKLWDRSNLIYGLAWSGCSCGTAKEKVVSSHAASHAL